jgi:hypothetical protein
MQRWTYDNNDDNVKENEHLLDDVRLHSSSKCLHPGLPCAAQRRCHRDGDTAVHPFICHHTMWSSEGRSDSNIQFAIPNVNSLNVSLGS